MPKASERTPASTSSQVRGTDTVAPRDPKAYFGVYEMWNPVWQRLSPATRDKIARGNYERIFNAARTKVRAWEKKNSASVAARPANSQR